MPHRNPFVLNCLSLAGALFLSCSCGFDSASSVLVLGADPNRIRIMSWNAQTFFDDEECGNEFDEFRGGSTDWNTERYEGRLDRLRDAILLGGKTMGMGPDRGPDIVALEEIENSRVVRDLCNRMPSLGTYAHAAFVPSTGTGSFGIALLSRYPIVSVTAHTTHSPDISLRPILEASLDAPCGPLTVFAVHWKSKSGPDSGRSIREAQERALVRCIERLKSESPLTPYIVCGDFNCTPAESAFLAASTGLWSVNGDDGGSYWYNGAWERIDNMLWSGHFANDAGAAGPAGADSAFGWRVSSAQPLAELPLVDSEGHPQAYRIGLDRGYSDHLPLLAELSRRK